jgi:hypothetical protein
MFKAFAGQTLEQYELAQSRARNLAEVNRAIELRLAMLGYVFRDQAEMRRRIETAFNTTADLELRQVMLNDYHLMNLIELNAQIGKQ